MRCSIAEESITKPSDEELMELYNSNNTYNLLRWYAYKLLNSLEENKLIATSISDAQGVSTTFVSLFLEILNSEYLPLYGPPFSFLTEEQICDLKECLCTARPKQIRDLY